MKQTSITSMTPIDGLSPAHAIVGRALLIFTALLLIVMPWTEYYWHFDHFLRGGQDCEFGILFLATVLSLVIVLSQCRKQTTAFIQAVRRWIANIFQNTLQPTPRNSHGLIAPFQSMLGTSPSSKLYNLPLQI